MTESQLLSKAKMLRKRALELSSYSEALRVADEADEIGDAYAADLAVMAAEALCVNLERTEDGESPVYPVGNTKGPTSF